MEDYFYIDEALKDKLLTGEDRKYFQGELFRYAATIQETDNSTIRFMQIIPNNHLLKTNSELYQFLKKHDIKDISYAIIKDKSNHISVLGTINPKNSYNTSRKPQAPPRAPPPPAVGNPSSYLG